MKQFLFIAGYCLFCVGASAMVMKFLKTTWVYFIVAPTLSAMVAIAGDALWRGYLDTWAGVAFIVAWLIAFGCALGYYLLRRSIDKGRPVKDEPNESSMR